MTSRERVLTALGRGEPDRVPYIEFSVDRVIGDLLLGEGTRRDHGFDIESNQYSPRESALVADALGLDNLSYVLRAPVFARKIAGKDGRLYYGEGLVTSREDLGIIDLPDPEDESLYEQAADFAAKKGDRAACFVTRIGIFSAILSMGLDRFCLAAYDDPPFVETVLDIYCGWTEAVARHACALGFDIFVSTDDMAFKTAPYFSPQMFRELILPRFRRVARSITLPWIMHSDGNLMPIVEDLIGLGIAGLHPNEKGAMDIREMKRRYGELICLLGNVDLNILAEGTPEETDAEVRDLIRDIGPGGGYICTSGNSIASYCAVENVLALSAAVRRYGVYPIGR